MGLGSTALPAELLWRRERFAAQLRPRVLHRAPLESDHVREASVPCKTVLASTRLDVGVDVVSVASVAVIAPDSAQSRKLYVDALGLPLAAAEGSEYWHSEELAGTRHFAIWPLREAAQACFERREWPAHLSVPQASIEFELADAEAVSAAAGELEDRGFALLHAPREEPWGQTVARLLSAEGLIIGISFAPSLHEHHGREST